MKYLKRTGLSWWRGGGGSLLSLHPKTQALHTPPQLPAPVILRHTPLPSQRAAPTSNKLHHHPPAPHMDTPLLSPHACISGPPSYTSTCTHTLSPHTGIQVSLPLHTYAHARPHPFSPLCTCMHTRTHTHTHTHPHTSMRIMHLQKGAQTMNNFSAGTGQMRPTVLDGRPECQRWWPGLAPSLNTVAGQGGGALQQHSSTLRQEAGGGSVRRRSRLPSDCWQSAPPRGLAG